MSTKRNHLCEALSKGPVSTKTSTRGGCFSRRCSEGGRTRKPHIRENLSLTSKWKCSPGKSTTFQERQPLFWKVINLFCSLPFGWSKEIILGVAEDWSGLEKYFSYVWKQVTQRAGILDLDYPGKAECALPLGQEQSGSRLPFDSLVFEACILTLSISKTG